MNIGLILTKTRVFILIIKYFSPEVINQKTALQKNYHGHHE